MSTPIKKHRLATPLQSLTISIIALHSQAYMSNREKIPTVNLTKYSAGTDKISLLVNDLAERQNLTKCFFS